ncbi:hypothetical protein NEFER03_0085 [Nematocida sp. LUAm3]|nr:hypothetical protein NEFER03_0085 [Nematocida sp. LUAm3]KAI5173538.1 hypothetical protein NEFER02_0054 [Nematocida sp. LUAm2]KAI5176759.1 hypothetical protein NEFER01_0084 [Nematocida sp. LUAm1]
MENEKIFGVDLNTYIDPNDSDIQKCAAEAQNHVSAPETQRADQKPIGTVDGSIIQIEKEIHSINTAIHELLNQMGNKMGSLGISLNTAKKLDIQACNLSEDLQKLKKLFQMKLTNSSSLLRLRSGEVFNRVSSQLLRSSEKLKEFHQWISRIENEVKNEEKELSGRTTLSEIRVGSYILKKYEDFSLDMMQLEGILKIIEELSIKNQNLTSQEERTDIKLSESFIQLTTEEERTINHLLSLE